MKILSNRGYSVLKSSIDASELVKIKADLTVTPLGHPDFPPLNSFGVYEETDKYIRLPVAYANMRLGKCDNNLLASVPMNVPFVGKLRPAQVEPCNTAVSHLQDQGRGILCLVTGGGKSISALWIASQLGQKTLVIVHKRTLLEQWRDEIAKVMPSARVGIFRQSKSEYGNDFDITIAMWHTVLRRTGVPPAWGTVIMDECHRVCSKEFSQVMFKVNSSHVLGLSATPERGDGLDCVLEWHLGPVIHRQAPVQRSQLKTIVHFCKWYDPGFAMLGGGGRDFVKTLSYIVTSEERNDYIMECIDKIMKRDDASQRRLLLLTNRVGHAKELYLRLKKHQKDAGRPETVGLCVGTCKTKELVEAKKCDMIVATYALFEEGESVEHLNTIIFCTPKRNVTQALGRIFRKRHEICPLVIDVADTIFAGQMWSRLKTYRLETKGHLVISFFDHKMNEIKKDNRDGNEDEGDDTTKKSSTIDTTPWIMELED